MAKIAFSKLGLKINNEINTIDYNGINIEVKQYLPIDKKLELLTNVINNSITDKGFYNEAKVIVFLALEVVYAYTNINFTDKQKEDISKLYDLIVSSGLYDIISNNIPESEISFIDECLEEIIKSVYAYNNSAMGIIETITQNYDALDMDATEIQKKLSDPNNVALLRDVLSKLG